MRLDMELQGDEALTAALRQASQIVGQEAQKASDASLLLVAADLKQYPQEPPGSSYVRTLTLGRTWAAADPEWQAAPSGFEGKIGNPTPYGPYVESQEHQAAVHQGRWPTDEGVLASNFNRIKAHFEAAARRIVRRLGGS